LKNVRNLRLLSETLLKNNKTTLKDMVNIQGRILLRTDGEPEIDDDLFDGSGDEIEDAKAFIDKFVEEHQEYYSEKLPVETRHIELIEPSFGVNPMSN